MSKNRRKIVQVPGQRQLLPHPSEIYAHLKPEKPPEPMSMNIDLRLRHSVSEAIKRSGEDRIDICAHMYKLMGVEVSKHTLDSWTADCKSKSTCTIDVSNNKRWGIPAEVLPAFCQVTGYWEPLFILVEACNYKALKGKDVVRARMGLLKEEITRSQAELRQLEKALISVK